MSVIQFAKLAPIRKSRRVSALYVSSIGPYPRLVHDVWTVARDARHYKGPLPVIVHPPCGPWGKLRANCTKQDPLLAICAVDQVRRWGGVLEHPAHSLLFSDPRCMLPRPLEGPDVCGGHTFHVDQVWLGHKCRKSTWLYVVRSQEARMAKHDTSWVERVEALLHAAWVAGQHNPVTRRICSGPRMRHVTVASRRVRILTPDPLAKLLIRIAAEMGDFGP